MGGAAAQDRAVSHVCAVRKHWRPDVVTYHAGLAGTLDGRGCVRRTLPWGGRMPKGVGHAMVGISVRVALDDVRLWCCARVVRGVRCAWSAPSPSGYARTAIHRTHRRPLHSCLPVHQSDGALFWDSGRTSLAHIKTAPVPRRSLSVVSQLQQ